MSINKRAIDEVSIGEMPVDQMTRRLVMVRNIMETRRLGQGKALAKNEQTMILIEAASLFDYKLWQHLTGIHY
jgi:hypothetical protein